MLFVLDRPVLLWLFPILFLAVIWYNFLSPTAVHAAACAITATTTVNQAYIDSNSCDTINIIGSSLFTVTWSGTTDLSGAGMVNIGTGSVIFSGAVQLGSTDDLTVTSTGIITHATGSTTGVNITARNLTIDAGGAINTNEKGCQSGVTTGGGWGPDATTGICTITTTGYGKHRWGGAAHGGSGGTGNGQGNAQTTTYGSSTAPTLLGSGGGGWDADPDTIPGSGGGVIKLTLTGTLTVNGTISANGGSGPLGGGNNGSSGGSGGSVYILTGTLAGSGSIMANGGSGSANAGGAGGGRVAVLYDTLSGFSRSSITATKGLKGGVGSPGDGENGSTFILDRRTDDGSGNIYITSGFLFGSGVDYSRTSFTIENGATLNCDAQTTLTISATTFTDAGSTFNCSNAITDIVFSPTTWNSTGTNWNFTNADTMTLTATTWNPGTVSTTLALTKSGSRSTWNISNNLTFTQFHYIGAVNAGTTSGYGGFLHIPSAISWTLTSSTILSSVSSTQLTTISVDANSSIDASGRGCPGVADSGYGPHATTGVCTQNTTGYGLHRHGGAAHGGAGGTGNGQANPQTTTYGSSTQPILLGASGAGWTASPDDVPGPGGGVIYLQTSGAFTNNGSIWSNGGIQITAVNNGSAGSAGGSVNILAGTLAGSGTFRAQGGAGTTNGGGGGGGRISLRYSTLTFSGTSSTSGGAAGGVGSPGPGSDGSIYLFQTNVSPDVPSSLGPTALVNGSTTGTNNPIFSFTLSDPDVDTVKYRIQIDDSSNFGSPVVDYTSALAAEGARTFQVGQAAGSGSYTVGSAGQTLSDTSYYWRVKTIDAAAAESSYSTANSGAVAFIVDTATRFLSFQLSSGSGAESVTATSIRILLNTTHFENVTVNYSVIAASTTAEGAGVDYTLSSGTATITAGQTSTTFSLTVGNDAIDEPDETIGIQLSSPTYAVIGSNTTTLYTITDNDTAGVTITEPGGSTTSTEGGATDTFTVVLTSQPTSTVQVLFTTSTYGVTLSTSTLTFTGSNWNSAQTVTVTATNDDIYEGTHTTSVQPTISATGLFAYPSVSIASVSVTITDNDTAGVTVSSVTGSAVEGGASATYTLVLTSQPTSTVTVALTPDTGELSLAASTLSFTSSNWNTPQTVTVSAINDSIDEANYATSVTHLITSTGLLGYTSALSIASASVNVTDNDTAGVTITEPGGSTTSTEGGATDTFTVVLTSQPTSTVQISFTTSTFGLTLSTSTITFTGSNWNTPQTVTVTATNDDVFEGTHTTSVQPTISATGLFAYPSVSIASVSATITDNDTAGVTVSSVTGSAVEGGASATYTLVLTSQPTSTVTVALTPDTGELSLAASTLSFTSANWSTPQTVTVSAINDSIDEASYATSVTHLITSTGLLGYTSALSIASASITVTDNDTAGVTISPTTRALSEGGASSTYTIVLDTQPTSTIQVLLTVPSDLTVSASTLTFTQSNWNTPQTVTVNATQDSLQEGAHIATTTHAVNLPSGFAFGYATLSSISAFVATIADDEVASIAIAPTTLRIREAETGSYTVILGTAPTTTVRILLVPSGDVTLSTSTLTFTTSNWNTPQTVTASVPSDTTVLGDRLGTITQTVSTTALGYSALTLSPITVTLVEIQARGGGAAGSGAGGTSGTGGGGMPSPIALVVQPTPPFITPSPSISPLASLPPIIPVEVFITPAPSAPASPATPSAPSPALVREIVQVLNPTDVLSLVEATNKSRDFTLEERYLGLLQKDTKEFKIKSEPGTLLALTNFVTYGISERTRALGAGERRAVVRDALQTMRTTNIHPGDLERLARGVIPVFRNIEAERSQLSRVRQTFRTIYGHDPNFKDPSENLAWNTLMYRIRFPRDLRAEREGIQDFRRTFGRVPNTPFQWAVVRVMGYVR